MSNRHLRGAIGLAIGAAFLAVSAVAPAQTKTDVAALQRFAADYAAKAKRDKADAIRLARIMGIPVTETTPDGRYRELMRFIGNMPVYYETMNLGAAKTVGADKLWPNGISGLNLSGQGVLLGEWDAGATRITHQEIVGRATNPYSVATHWHSTHVSGTMIATGVDPNAHGMSFQGTLHSYDWNHEADMATEAAAGLTVSNHSYGVMYYGGYEDEAVARDTLAYSAPNYLICQAAGNSGSSYQTLIVPAFAKDILTVAAVVKNPNGYSGPSSVTIADFSSRGPAEDGRIKPDIAAPGVDLYSCLDTSDTSYTTMSGTSMATPTTSGNIGLITQYWRSTHNTMDMRAATMKALVIHTADEAGPADGPDYNYGWGQLDSYSACMVIKESLVRPEEITEQTLQQGDTFTYHVTADGLLPLKVTICWTDPPGKSKGTDPAPDLVNDLDLRVSNNGTTYKPWVLDPANPDTPATTGDNVVDNVEQVVFQPVAGPCTITVTHKGSTLTGGSQAFSMIVTGTVSAHLTGLSVAPSGIAAGQAAVGTVTLNAPASSAGAKISLSCSNKAACTVPPTVSVQTADTQANFNIVAKTVLVPTPVTITAKYGTATFTADLTINPSWLTSLTLNPSSVTGGTVSNGTVSIGKVAGPGGSVVTMSSDNPAVASVFWKVLIPEGQTSANFQVTTYPVSTSKTVTITAAYPGPSLSTPLTVVPPVGVSAVTLAPATVPGGNPSTGTVTLVQAAPAGGAVVTLSSDNSAATVPATVTVPAGQVKANFTVSTTAVSQQKIANITASYLGGTKSAALTINQGSSIPLLLVLSPSSVKGGGSVVATVTSNTPAPAGGLVVKLSASNRTSVDLPKTVTIPAGLFTATFTITTSAVPTNTVVAISATATSKAANANLTILH